jgi:hypothetical protein
MTDQEKLLATAVNIGERRLEEALRLRVACEQAIWLLKRKRMQGAMLCLQKALERTGYAIKQTD